MNSIFMNSIFKTSSVDSDQIFIAKHVGSDFIYNYNYLYLDYMGGSFYFGGNYTHIGEYYLPMMIMLPSEEDLVVELML